MTGEKKTNDAVALEAPFDSLHGAGLYFNDRHQLLWQMIPTSRGRLIYRSVGRDEILRHFPDASAVLEQWRRGSGEEHEEAGHGLL